MKSNISERCQSEHLSGHIKIGWLDGLSGTDGDNIIKLVVVCVEKAKMLELSKTEMINY